MNFMMYRPLPADYKRATAERSYYMDYPYHIYRESIYQSGEAGKVKRACTRYLADALAFVKAMVPNEVNPCEWTVINEESGRICYQAQYRDGKVVVL
jgi:hypothetical protein